MWWQHHINKLQRTAFFRKRALVLSQISIPTIIVNLRGITRQSCNRTILLWHRRHHLIQKLPTRRKTAEVSGLNSLHTSPFVVKISSLVSIKFGVKVCYFHYRNTRTIEKSLKPTIKQTRIVGRWITLPGIHTYETNANGTNLDILRTHNEGVV